MTKEPKYSKKDVFSAIRKGNFEVRRKALGTSSTFGLRTEKDVANFILRGGLENLTFYNTTELDKTDEYPKPIVDAYNFTTGSRKGYIAFYFSNNGKLVIKSLKPDKYEGDTMKYAFIKAGF
ncbi:hypothetical protein AB3N58_10100 [Leptospira sp. WS60.C2]